VHDYDVVRWFAGNEPTRIYAESQFGVLRGFGYDVEDANWALITFGNGVLAACETGWILPEGHPAGSDARLAVQGTDGRLDVELMYQGITLSTSVKSSHLDTLFMPRIRGELRSIFVDEVRHFVACVRDGAAPLVTAQDAIAAVEMAEAVVESARTHQPVFME
jgi:predicted dehydrogenase